MLSSDAMSINDEGDNFCLTSVSAIMNYLHI